MCIGDWDKLGDFNGLEQRSVASIVNKTAKGGVKLGKYATALSMSMHDDEEVRRLVKHLEPPTHVWNNVLNLSPYDIATYYPPENLQRDDDVAGALAYFQGIHGDTKELLCPWISRQVVSSGLQKIMEHPVTSILAAAPYVDHTDRVSFNNASWAMNTAMIRNSLVAGTWMEPEAIGAWLKSGVVQAAIIKRIRDPNPKTPTAGWWYPGGEPLIKKTQVIPTIELK